MAPEHIEPLLSPTSVQGPDKLAPIRTRDLPINNHHQPRDRHPVLVATCQYRRFDFVPALPALL
jgi:hypothetical protein